MNPGGYPRGVVAAEPRSVPDAVFDFIVSNIASQYPELEGAFNTVLCFSLLPATSRSRRPRSAKGSGRADRCRKLDCATIMDIRAPCNTHD
jgi:chromosomal replication initiation ATPase DnaA